ncbi:ammonium transporter, partial [Anaerosporobacter sp.]|uniref:ammonium transporter n=1 Tax=Anaerosporobacter sp. TaxID=1872529 RepID=UPI00286F1413
KFIAYVIYSIVISAVVYPISGHWIWNTSGWLHKLGFHDFAGGTAVHLVGGLSALIGAKLVGARIGKYSKNGKSHAIPGHNITLGALGIFILWFGWFGFNGSSTLSITGDAAIIKVGGILVATNLSAAAAATMAMVITWVRYGKADISMTLNGALAGLVAITAGSDQVSPIGAVIIGIIAGFVVVFGIEIIDNKFKIDDPVGAFSVHGLCGALGTILTGLLSVEKGAFYVKGGIKFFGTQCLGVVTIGIYVIIVMNIVFRIIDKVVGLRVATDVEIAGLDLKEHGLVSGYVDVVNTKGDVFERPVAEVDVADNIEIDASQYKADGKIRKVVVIMNQNRFESLKEALDKIDITGMTVSNVSGCGIQKGSTEYYRGSEFESHLLPKVKVEIVISTVPLGLLVETIKRAIYTGKIGDGKIFVYDVENVIKVRTNEEGRAALE